MLKTKTFETEIEDDFFNCMVIEYCAIKIHFVSFYSLRSQIVYFWDYSLRCMRIARSKNFCCIRQNKKYRNNENGEHTRCHQINGQQLIGKSMVSYLLPSITHDFSSLQKERKIYGLQLFLFSF